MSRPDDWASRKFSFGGFGAFGGELAGDGIGIHIDGAGEAFRVVHGCVIGERERAALVFRVVLEADFLSVEAAGYFHGLIGGLAAAGNLIVRLSKSAVLVAFISFDAVVKGPLASEIQ